MSTEQKVLAVLGLLLVIGVTGKALDTQGPQGPGQVVEPPPGYMTPHTPATGGNSSSTQPQIHTETTTTVSGFYRD